MAKEPRRESADELALCSSSKASSSSPPRSWTSACASGTATRWGKRGCSEPAARTPTPIPVAPGHGRSISVRPMRHGRSHPPSPRPPPALAKPRPRELWRTGAASESSMISDGRSSGPDRKDVGAARTGRSSSSLDESAIGLQWRSWPPPTGEGKFLVLGVKTCGRKAHIARLMPVRRFNPLPIITPSQRGVSRPC